MTETPKRIISFSTKTIGYITSVETCPKLTTTVKSAVKSISQHISHTLQMESSWSTFTFQNVLNHSHRRIKNSFDVFQPSAVGQLRHEGLHRRDCDAVADARHLQQRKLWKLTHQTIALITFLYSLVGFTPLFKGLILSHYFYVQWCGHLARLFSDTNKTTGTGQWQCASQYV